jgi:hypothetical protein
MINTAIGDERVISIILNGMRTLQKGTGVVTQGPPELSPSA